MACASTGNRHVEVGERATLGRGEGTDAHRGAFEHLPIVVGQSVAGAGELVGTEDERAARLEVAEPLRVLAQRDRAADTDIVHDVRRHA